MKNILNHVLKYLALYLTGLIFLISLICAIVVFSTPIAYNAKYKYQGSFANKDYNIVFRSDNFVVGYNKSATGEQEIDFIAPYRIIGNRVYYGTGDKVQVLYFKNRNQLYSDSTYTMLSLSIEDGANIGFIIFSFVAGLFHILAWSIFFHDKLTKNVAAKQKEVDNTTVKNLEEKFGKEYWNKNDTE